jgi:glycosyltransferase involved in cell wall biosynthesis
VTDSASPVFLTIIIPAYNEERRLPPTLQKIATFLRSQPYRSEVLVVENGSRDDTSGATERFIAEQMRADDPFTVVLAHSTPGKGAAVRHGMLMGQGEFLFICDADLDLLGRSDFWELNRDLLNETLHFSMNPPSEEAWLCGQLRFLETHHYFTHEARLLRDQGKAENTHRMLEAVHAFYAATAQTSEPCLPMSI